MFETKKCYIKKNRFWEIEFEKNQKENNIDIKYPSPVLCTDNAAMIGCAGYYSYINGRRDDMSLNAVPNLRIGQK